MQCQKPGFDPWVGKIPWRREMLPTPVFLPGEFHGQRSLADATGGLTSTITWHIHGGRQGSSLNELALYAATWITFKATITEWRGVASCRRMPDVLYHF